MISNAARLFLDRWDMVSLAMVIQHYKLKEPHATHLRKAFQIVLAKAFQKPIGWLYLKSNTGQLGYETYYVRQTDIDEDIRIYKTRGDTPVTFAYPQTEQDFASFMTELVQNW